MVNLIKLLYQRQFVEILELVKSGENVDESFFLEVMYIFEDYREHVKLMINLVILIQEMMKIRRFVFPDNFMTTYHILYYDIMAFTFAQLSIPRYKLFEKLKFQI